MQKEKTTRQKSNENHRKAWDYFLMTGQIPLISTGWVLHHKDPSWQHDDLERYVQWNIEDLIPMTQSEHLKLHNKSREYKPISEQTRRKMSESHIGKDNHQRGKHPSEDTKRKISDALRGRKVTDEQRKHYSESSKKILRGFAILDCKWYNNGNEEIYIEAHLTPPQGFVAGRLPTSDEVKAKLSKSMSGRKWYNNGEVNLRLKSTEKVPEGFVKGKLSVNKRKN